MRQIFPLFQSHLDLAHSYISKTIKKNDIAIDATLGGGHDTLYLAKHPLKELHCFDIQKEAHEKAKTLLKKELNEKEWDSLHFHLQSHETFPDFLKEVGCIVYNLGYLPGGDKKITTEVTTTLNSVKEALTRLRDGGIITITCYPGHQEGREEERTLVEWTKTLSPHYFNVCYHTFLNRQLSPSLILIQFLRGKLSAT